MRIFTLVAGSAAMWIFVASCSGAGTSSSGSVGAATSSSGSGGMGSDAATALIDNFCDQLAEPFCEAYLTCCTVAGSDLNNCNGQFFSDALSHTGNPLEFCIRPPDAVPNDKADLEASLRAGTTIFDQGQFDTCLTLLKSMATGGAACVRPVIYAARTVCLSAFRGQIPTGEPCPWQGSSEKGSPTAFMESVIQCKDGRCEAGKCVPFLKLGDSCASDLWNLDQPANELCNYAHDEWCKRTIFVGSKGTCTPMGDIGDACDPGVYAECKGWGCASGTCTLPEPTTTVCYSFP